MRIKKFPRSGAMLNPKLRWTFCHAVARSGVMSRLHEFVFDSKCRRRVDFMLFTWPGIDSSWLTVELGNLNHLVFNISMHWFRNSSTCISSVVPSCHCSKITQRVLHFQMSNHGFKLELVMSEIPPDLICFSIIQFIRITNWLAAFLSNRVFNSLEIVLNPRSD